MALRFDYEQIGNLTDSLEKIFKDLNNLFYSIEDTNKKINSSATWESDAKNYYRNKCKQLNNNFDTVKAHTGDIITYLEGITSNYKNFEQQASSIISRMGDL